MEFNKPNLKKSLKVAGVIVFIGVGLIPIYQRFVEPRIDHINQYAELLGEKLLAMVPEGSEKETLANDYQEFLEKVKNREVEPEKVERVAANILNATNANKTLTPKQAEAVLKTAFIIPEVDSFETVIKVKPVPEAKVFEKWAEAGERLKYAFEFQTKLQEEHRQKAHEHPPLPKVMQFRFDDGLKIIVDDQLKTELTEQDFQEVAVYIEELEKQKILEWEKNFEKNFESRMKKMETSLEKMQREIEASEFEIQSLTALEALKSIQILDSIGISIPVNLDSILREVEIELKKVEVEESKNYNDTERDK